MKKFITIVVIASMALMPTSVGALTDVRDALVLGQFCDPINVDNVVATAVISDESKGFISVIMNNDSAANIHCSQRANTTSAGATRGFRLTPGAAAGFSLKPGQLWFCINDSGAPVSMVICKGR